MRSTDPKSSSKRYFRSSARVLQMNGAWYFATREGERGPFQSRERAQAELARYVQDIEQLRGFQESRGADARKRTLEPRNWRLESLEETAAPRIELTLEPL